MCRGHLSSEWSGIGTPQEVRALDVYAYFRQHGLDPSSLAPDFIPYWLERGKTPAQIFEVATNRRES